MMQPSYPSNLDNPAPADGEDSQASLQVALYQEMATLQHSIAEVSAVNGLSENNLNLLRGLVHLSQVTLDQAHQQVYAHQEQDTTLESLYYEVEQLRASNSIYEQQVNWMREQEALSRTIVGKLRLKAILRQTLESAISITQADTGSIFLLGSDNIIEDCILMQRNTTDDERRDLVGRVLQDGLAGWVVKNKTLAFIPNTRQDQRWIDLPNQPYRVGSVICIPLVNEGSLMGIITLTHPSYSHFTQEDASFVDTCCYQSAVVIHNVRLITENKRLKEQTEVMENQFRQLLQTPLVGVFLIQSSRFGHVNRKFAALTGYAKEELLQMPSIASVIAYEDREAVTQALKDCLTGKSPQFNLPFHLSRKNGTLIKVMAQGVVSHINGRRVVMAMVDAA